MNWFKYFKIYKKDFLIETKSSQVNPTRMKRVARKKRKGGGFTRVSACHLADAQSDLLLFLRNPTRFPIRDEKLVPPRLPFLLIQPSVSRRKSNSKFSLSLSSSVPFPSSFSHNSSLYSDFRLRILEDAVSNRRRYFLLRKKIEKIISSVRDRRMNLSRFLDILEFENFVILGILGIFDW